MMGSCWDDGGSWDGESHVSVTLMVQAGLQGLQGSLEGEGQSAE